MTFIFSNGCRKDIKAIEDFYTYIDIHDYARDSLFLSNEVIDTLNGLYKNGIYIKINSLGEGRIPRSYEKIYVYYKGRLLTGKEFSTHDKFEFDENGDTIKDDSGNPYKMPFSFIVNNTNVIRGWDSAFTKIPRGTTATFLIPPELAYGEVTQTRIPPNSPLRFDVELLWLVGDPLPDNYTDNETKIKSGPNIEISKLLGLITEN